MTQAARPGRFAPPLAATAGLLLSLTALGCAAEASGDPQRLVEKRDDPACLTDLAQFFGRYADDIDDLGQWWARPHESLFADDAAAASVGRQIQLSWEKEGSQPTILNFYRHPDYTDEAWMALPLYQRYRMVTTDPEQPAWALLVRMDTVAPWYVRPLLMREVNKRWETTTDGYLDRLDMLFQHAGYVQRTLGARGGFHWHASFPRPPEELLDDYMTFALQASEYGTLRMFGGSVEGVGNFLLGPLDTQRVALTRAKILERGASDLDDKYNTFSVRRIYDSPDRIGFELRVWNFDLDEARRAMATTVHFLEGPHTARIVFGTRGPGYTISEIRGVDRLGPDTFTRFPEQLQQYLRRGSGPDVYRSPGPELPGMTADESKDAFLLRRYAYPLVRWEERSYLPEQVRRTVQVERERFLADLEALRLEDAASGYSMTPMQVQHEIRERVHRWAAATQLWHYW